MVCEVQDIVSCDLFGVGNFCGNMQLVVVLKDVGIYLNVLVYDEGWVMVQLIYDVVFKVCFGFVMVFDGELVFVNNICVLVGIQGLLNFCLDFVVQIIVDDVQYYDEGMFVDIIVVQVVDDVMVLGVLYFLLVGNMLLM